MKGHIQVKEGEIFRLMCEKFKPWEVENCKEGKIDWGTILIRNCELHRLRIRPDSPPLSIWSHRWPSCCPSRPSSSYAPYGTLYVSCATQIIWASTGLYELRNMHQLRGFTIRYTAWTNRRGFATRFTACQICLDYEHRDVRVAGIIVEH